VAEFTVATWRIGLGPNADFQKSSKARKKKEQKSEVRRGDDVEIRERGAGYEVLGIAGDL
jgi:hypothetical protein